MPKLENVITCISGYKGSGKTVLMTYFLNLELMNKIKKIVYCNYKLSFPFKWLNAFDMLDNSSLFDSSVIGIDELHEYADSRSSSSPQNKFICGFFLQSRHAKMNETPCNIYYTTQFIDQIDKRIRRITDIDIHIENMHIDSDKDCDDDTFRMFIIDYRYRKSATNIFYAKPIFNMYDSGERINPFMLSKEHAKRIKEKIEKLYEEKFNK